MQPNYGSNPYDTYSRPAPAPRKEPFFSLIASFFIPGLGTILNGETSKGVKFMATFYLAPFGILLMGYTLFAVSGIYLYLPCLLVGILVAIGAWLWGLIDAYKGAEAHNARHGLH